jgi:hypothetical protein
MLTDTIVCGIASIDKTLFAQTGPCPHCGGIAAPHDTKEKIYATLRTPEKKKRSLCLYDDITAVIVEYCYMQKNRSILILGSDQRF